MSFMTDLPKATLSSSGAIHQVLAVMQSGSSMDRRIETVLEFIASSPIDATIESAASVVWISPSRLRHLFKEQVGLSFHKYLISIRLERARHLLRTTDWSIERMSASVGIQDRCHFSHTFKRAYGISPSTARGRRVKSFIPDGREASPELMPVSR